MENAQGILISISITNLFRPQRSLKLKSFCFVKTEGEKLRNTKKRFHLKRLNGHVLIPCVLRCTLVTKSIEGVLTSLQILISLDLFGLFDTLGTVFGEQPTDYYSVLDRIAFNFRVRITFLIRGARRNVKIKILQGRKR